MTLDQIAAVQAAPHAFSGKDINATIDAALAMPAVRQPLPTRRQRITVSTEWDGHAFTVTMGFWADGSLPCSRVACWRQSPCSLGPSFGKGLGISWAAPGVLIGVGWGSLTDKLAPNYDTCRTDMQ